MAEYKGLTIRIGGDTSQLNNALKSSTKAASTLQDEIRQITRAMRFDPGNLGNIDTRMKLTTNRAEALYEKVSLLKNGYRELGQSTVTVGGSVQSVRELAEATDNVALSAKTADERYNEMTRNLASRYREIEARAKEAGEAINLNALSRQDSGETFETQMAKLKELGVVTDEEVQKLREMRTVWNEAFGDKEALDKAQQFERMAVDIQRFESEAKNAAATVRELNTVSNYSAENWHESTARIKTMDSALSECANQARAYEAALREDPSNLSAAVGRLRALSSEYDLAGAKASELSNQVEAYKSRLSGVLSEHRNLPLYIKETGEAWEKVHDELNKAKGDADTLHKSLQKLKDEQAPAEQIKQLEAAVAEADAKVDRLAADAKKMDEAFETSKECAELEQLQSKLAETGAHAGSLKERMKLTSLGGKNLLDPSTIKSAGMTLYSTLTPAITMLGWRTVTAAQEMDSAYRDMRKTVSGTETQFEELKQAAIDFSKTHVTSAGQILQIEAIGGELGIATEDLKAFAETVSNLDVATNLNTDEAAESLGKLANITHMTSDEYDNYADALVRLGNNGASTEDQIVDIATRIGSMGTIVGMTVPEILALSSSIASTGMKTEAAGTAISNTFSDIESAVANGGDKLEAFAKVAGTSAEEFANSWRTHPIEAFQAFIVGLNRIESEGGSATATLEAMGITGERQKQSILGLMQTIGGLNDNLAMSQHAWDGQSDAWGAAGDAAREADKKAEGFSGQLSILSNIGNDAMASLAEGATPVISAFTSLAQAALNMFDGMDSGAKTATVVALGIGAVIGPVLTMASTFMIAKRNIKEFVTESNAMGKAIAIMKTGFAEAGTGAGSMKMKVASLGEAAKSVGKSIGKDLAMAAVAIGITVAIAAIVDYIKKLKEAEEASRNAGNVIGDALGSSVANQAKSLGEITTSYDDMVSKMASNNAKIQESANKTYGNVALIEQYRDSVVEALNAYNSGDRSAESMANLKTQLELYNSAAGTSVSFTQDAAGALHLMKDGAELSADAFDRLSESIVSAAKAEFFKESYTTKMGDYRTALDGVADAEKKVAEARQKYSDAMSNGNPDLQTQELNNLENALGVLDDAKQKLGETRSAMNQYEEGMKLMTEAQMDNASAAVKWMADNDAIQSSIWNNNQSVTDFAHDLAGLGLGFDELNAHSSDIANMAVTWDGSIGSMIASLNSMGIELDLSQVKIDGLNEKNIDNKTYWVSDNGTVFDQTGKVIGLIDDIGNIHGTDFTVTDNGSASQSQTYVDNLTGSIQRVPPNTSATVRAEVEGGNAVWDLVSAISNVRDKAVSIVATAFGFGSATGSIANSPYIPRHASGYIATGPTLTNNGWVGEDGAEAILNWGSGGAVVPLTNPKYMEPIADAIAANLNMEKQQGDNFNITIIGAPTESPEQFARKFTRAVARQQRTGR